MNKCEITAHELADSKWPVDQAIYFLLKEKGAPILGNFNLRLDPDYEFTMHHDLCNDSYVYEWEKTCE